MYTPNSSNLNSTAGALQYAVGPTGSQVTVTLAEAFAVIDTYISSVNTANERQYADVAAQRFNELVAAVNAFAA